jgi:hypothetical protein
MKSLPLSLAVGALALGLASSAQAAMSVHRPHTPSLVEKAGCYDECEYYMEAAEEAREEAHEAAAYAAEEYAEQAEEAAEYGYSRRSSGRRRGRTASPTIAETPAAAKKPSKSVEEKSTTPSAKKKDVAVNASGNCKQYSPATGIILSVPCE